MVIASSVAIFVVTVVGQIIKTLSPQRKVSRYTLGGASSMLGYQNCPNDIPRAKNITRQNPHFRTLGVRPSYSPQVLSLLDTHFCYSEFRTSALIDRMIKFCHVMECIYSNISWKLQLYYEPLKNGHDEKHSTYYSDL